MKRKQPSASHCFVCGVENTYGLKMAFYSQDNGQVVCDFVVPEQFQGYPGVTHGGIVAAMLDETLARALMVSDPDRFVFTARLTTRYRKPTPIEQPIKLVGEVRRDRGRMANYWPKRKAC
jgi:acyl-coenzyme A thioesterase PaaI-like protein